MKYIGAKQLSEELNLEENLFYDEFLKVVEEEAERNPDRFFLVHDEKKGVYIVDQGDLNIILDGFTEKLPFAQVTEGLDVDFEAMNWVLHELHERNAINEMTLNHYIELKEKPIFKIYYEPEQVSEGEEVSLVVELVTDKDVESPKFILKLPDDIELNFEPTLPDVISSGRRIDKYQLLGLRHGPKRIEVTFQGMIEGVQYEEELPVPPLKVISLPPELRVERVPRTSVISATYNQDVDIILRVSNVGRGAAQNVEVRGLNEHEEFRLLRGENVGIVSVKGRIDHPITIRPIRSGDLVLNDITIHYEDGDGNLLSTQLEPFTVRVSTLKPELKIDLDVAPMVESGEIFPLTLKVTNIGQGEARDIRFNIAVTPTEARMQGPVDYTRRRLNVSQSDENQFRIKAPDGGEVVFETTGITFNDEEGAEMNYKMPPLKIPVRKSVGAERMATNWPFNVGEVINRNFQIIEEVGEGGFSKVYLVEDLFLRQRRALKALKQSFINDPSAVESFIEEAKKSLNLRSPNIISVYGADNVDHMGQSFPYIIMEYISGGTLQDKIIPGNPMDFMESCYTIQDLCFALIAAHHQKIIHCDIKPSNTFFDNEQEIWKLGDFGMAKVMRGREALSTGYTLGYMAPEARDDPPIITEKSDIYSLGVLFREMVTGAPRGDLGVVKEVNRNVDPSSIGRVTEIIEKMTSRDPQQRPDLSELITIVRISTIKGR